MDSAFGAVARATTRGVAKCPAVGLVVSTAAFFVSGSAAFAAKKVKACTLVPQAQLETAVGNTFETPEDTTIGNFQGDCRFPSADTTGADLNLFLANDVKGGVKDAPLGLFFATKKSFVRRREQHPQGSLLVLDGKNHAALIVLTGSGITAENTVEKGKAVAAVVLPKLK